MKIIAGAGVIAAFATLATPAVAQSKAAGKARVETQAQCEARQQKIRDPVSGVRIQAGDAARFCSRQQSRR